MNNTNDKVQSWPVITMSLYTWGKVRDKISDQAWNQIAILPSITANNQIRRQIRNHLIQKYE